MAAHYTSTPVATGSPTAPSGRQARSAALAPLHPADFGLSGDPAQDATSALQQMLDEAQASGRAAVLAHGTYRTTAPLVVHGALTLEGVGAEPYQGMPLDTMGSGSWLYFDHPGRGIVAPGPGPGAVGPALSGLVLRRFGTYRPQPVVIAGVPWAPGDFDWDLHLGSVDVLLDDLVLLNPTRGIRKGNGNYGRLQINNLRGQPLRNGIVIEDEYDVPVMNGIRWWPFWQDRAEVHEYTVRHRLGMLFYRCDGLQLTNYFGIRELASLAFGQNASGHGTMLRGTVTNVYSDLSKHGILVDGEVTHGITLQVANFVHFGEGAGTSSAAIRVRGNNCRLDFANADMSNESGAAALIEGSGNVVHFANARSHEGWNKDGTGAPFIFCGAGNTVRIDQEASVAHGGGAAHVGGGGRISYRMVRSGTAQIAAGEAAVTVRHGLAGTPRLDQIQVTPANAFGRKASWFVADATRDSFRIVVAGAAADAAPSFVWRASLE